MQPLINHFSCGAEAAFITYGPKQPADVGDDGDDGGSSRKANARICMVASVDVAAEAEAASFLIYVDVAAEAHTKFR